jgi:hypothetical protein
VSTRGRLSRIHCSRTEVHKRGIVDTWPGESDPVYQQEHKGTPCGHPEGPLWTRGLPNRLHCANGNTRGHIKGTKKCLCGHRTGRDGCTVQAGARRDTTSEPNSAERHWVTADTGPAEPDPRCEQEHEGTWVRPSVLLRSHGSMRGHHGARRGVFVGMAVRPGHRKVPGGAEPDSLY